MITTSSINPYCSSTLKNRRDGEAGAKMRKKKGFGVALLLVLFGMVVGCQHSQHRALRYAPEWFLERNIQSNNGQVLGYGYGRDYEEAKASAMSDIAYQLEVEFNSTLTKTTSTGFASIDSSRHTISVSADMLLNNLAEHKKEVSDHGVYALLSYRDSSLLHTMLSLIDGTTCDDLRLMKNSNFLQYTPAHQAVKQRLGCFAEINYWFRNNRWYVQYKDQHAQISSEDLKQFYTEHKNPSVALQLTDEVIESSNLYQILVTARKEGYMSLFQISAEGNSQLLLDNVPVTGGDLVSYPDMRHYLGLQARNDSKSIAIKDLLLVALCPVTRNMSPIAAIHDDAPTSDNRQFLSYLMQEIDACDVSTQFLTILPGKEA